MRVLLLLGCLALSPPELGAAEQPGDETPGSEQPGTSAAPKPATPEKRSEPGRIDPGPPPVYRDERRAIALALPKGSRPELRSGGFLVRATDADGLAIGLAEPGKDDGAPGDAALARWVEVHVPGSVPYVQPGARRDIYSFLATRDDGEIVMGSVAYVAAGRGKLVLLFEIPESDSRLVDARLEQIERSLATTASAAIPALGSIATLRRAAEAPVTPAATAPPSAASEADAGGAAPRRHGSVDPLHLTGPPPESATLFEAIPPDGRPLREVLKGSKVVVDGSTAGFLKVTLEDGTSGYMDHTDVAMESTP